MSWNINLLGKPEKVVEALKAHSEKLNGQSKVEYDAALPHLVGLAENNFGQEGIVLDVDASGSGYSVEGVQKNRTCSASVKVLYKTLVTCIVLAVSLCLADVAMAQCARGRVFRDGAQVNLGGGGPFARAGRVAIAPLRAGRALLGRTRFFDGDGRPFRRSSNSGGAGLLRRTRFFDGDGRPFRRAQ